MTGRSRRSDQSIRGHGHMVARTRIPLEDMDCGPVFSLFMQDFAKIKCLPRKAKLRSFDKFRQKTTTHPSDSRPKSTQIAP